MHLTLYMDAGKPAGQSLMAAGDTCPETSRRLFVRDKASGFRFLIDTGADISFLAGLRSLTTCFPQPMGHP